MSDDEGQALIIAVLFLAVAAAAVAGLRTAQEHIASVAERRRAGEAAVEAATAVIADAYVEELQRAATALPAATPDVAGAVSDGRAIERARVAASELGLRNGAAAVPSVDVRCADGAVIVSLVLYGATYRAGFAAIECSPR